MDGPEPPVALVLPLPDRPVSTNDATSEPVTVVYIPNGTHGAAREVSRVRQGARAACRVSQ